MSKRNPTNRRRARRRLASALAFALVAGLVPLLVPAAAQAATLSETEPNRNRTFANAFALGDTMQATSYEPYVSGDTDYFAVDLPSAGRVSIDLRFASGLSGDMYTVEGLSETGPTLYRFALTAAHSNGAWLRGQATYAPAGRFYVAVTGNQSWQSWDKPYTLRVTLSPGSVETEPNDYRNAPDVLTIGRATSGAALTTTARDDDWYALDVPKPGRLSLDFRFASGLSGDVYELSVYDATGTQLFYFPLTAARSNGSWLRQQATYLPTGRVFIRVTALRTWDSWGKAYTISAGFKAGQVETEPNDYISAPDVLSLGKATLGSALAARSYDYDYYAVDLSAARKVSLKLAFQSGLGSADTFHVDVFNPSRLLVHSVKVTANRHSGAWLAGQVVPLPKGRSFVRIYATNQSPAWGKAYQLTVFSALTATAKPKISGTATVGKTLTAKPGTWKPSKVTLKYQWLRGGKAIAKATKATYKLTTADAGKKISVKVTGSRSGYTSVSKTSAAVTALRALTASPKPKISGTATVGKTLTAKPGTWKPSKVTLKYQWLRGGKAIAKATKATYKLTAKDKGKKISVKVTGSKKGYRNVAKTSAAKTIK